MKSALLAISFLAVGCIAEEGINLKQHPNILFLVADDLRPFLGTYKNDQMAITPNLDKLAKKSAQFNAAYAQQALCAPSRNSFLTSRRPDTLKLYDFYSYWRNFAGNFTTLPQYLKSHGYHTVSVGKIFHPGISSNFSDDYPHSWSQKPFHPKSEEFKDAKVCSSLDDEKLHRNIVCPVEISKMPGNTLPDIETAQFAIDFLRQRASSSTGVTTPFFLAVGFHKPHIPLKFPKEFSDLYPIENVTLTKHSERPLGYPTVAWNSWLDLRKREDVNNLHLKFPYEPVPDTFAKRIRQAYFASTSYIDHLVGQLLDELSMSKSMASNTIIVFFGDHGWSLGELGEWAKYSNQEAALRVPLILHIPGITDHTPEQIDAPVELLDIFPTLVEAVGLERMPECPSESRISRQVTFCTEGRSLLKLMRGLEKQSKGETIAAAAFSQYPRPGAKPTLRPNSDEPRLRQIQVMGYSVRVPGFRYTEWVRFNPKVFAANWTAVVDVELYDLLRDPDGVVNRAFDMKFAGVRAKPYAKKILKKVNEWLVCAIYLSSSDTY
ncbi:unnamed protein product [Notodromas monacha]|uniref:Sulfatase N-terminal domain-containing protein n=1 Tax=Notodromas monacha TaxID=399045 RepID=A0A7R9BNQ8_9CRUS|nr:unnamed protein product [Notodromas monacha]CAG0917364.1 unnamed protein product [Notodromas monacha]